MAEIDGQYEGPSVTRALARSKYKKQMKEHEQPMEGAGGADEHATEHMAKIHPHAKGASKSFHVYQHPDGKLHAHAHDHESGTHEHKDHVSMADVQEHMMTHMPEEKAEIRAEREGGEAEPQMHEGGMEQLGMGM